MTEPSHPTHGKPFLLTPAGYVVIVVVATIIAVAGYVAVGLRYKDKVEQPAPPLPISGDTGVEVLPQQ